MDDESNDVQFVSLSHTFGPKELAIVEKAVTNAVLEALHRPRESLEQFIASQVKLELEYRLPGAWNCIVGEKFGASVNVEENTYGQFHVDDKFNVFIYKNPSLGIGK